MPNPTLISAIRLHWVQVPLHEPFKISNGEVSLKDAILVEVRAQNGIAGWGEASPMGGSFYSSETPESSWEFLRGTLVPGLVGHPVPEATRCFDWLSEFPGEPFAKAGLEGAIWNFWANQEARPLYELLGGRRRPVASGAAIGLMPSIDELLDRVERFLGQDESAEGLEAIETILRLGSARILNIKSQRMGGLQPARQAHDAAHKVGIPCWMGTMPELGVASAQALHLATLGNFAFPTDVEASARWYKDDIIAPPIEISGDGFVHLPDGPGMGYQVDMEKVARYRIRFEEFLA